MQAALSSPLRDSATIRSCTLLDHRQRDGQRGAAQYEVEIEGPDFGAVSRLLVSTLSLGGPRTRRLWRQITEMDLPPVVPGTSLRPFAYDPNLDVLFQVFPYDARLPALRELVPTPSSDFVNALQSERQIQLEGPGSWRGEMIRYRPDMRATVRLDFIENERSTTPGVACGFAKVFRDSEQAQRAFVLQDGVFRSLGSGESQLHVARPVPLAPGYNTLLTSAVSGVPLDRVLKRGNDPFSPLRAAAQAIAVLHNLRTPAPLRTADSEVTQVHQSGATIISAFPKLESLVRTIVERVATGLHVASAAFVHGDLKPEHVIVDSEGRVAIIDFDLAVMADPMIDIAHFIAFLERSASRSRTGIAHDADLISVFLDEYFAHAADEGRHRLGMYHAGTAVHKAAGLCRNPDANNARQAEHILDEGLRFATGELTAREAPSFKRRMTRTA